MKIKTIQDTSNVQSWEELRRFSSQSINDLVTVINGKIDLVDNCSTTLASVQFTKPNIEVEVKHSLGKIPSGYIVAGKSASFDIYNGSSPNTDSTIYVKGTVAGTATLLVF